MNAWRRLRHLYAAAILVALCVGPSMGQDENKVELASKSITPQRSTASDTQIADEGFVIGPEDLLAINVWKEPDISRSIPVRSDGKITLPLIGEIQASGKTPHTLEQRLRRSCRATCRSLRLPSSFRKSAVSGSISWPSVKARVLSIVDLQHGFGCHCCGRRLPRLCQEEINLRLAADRRRRARTSAV